MANAVDHKAMLYKLLGLADDSADDMVNERYKKAMEAEPDEEDKKLCNATNEAVATLKASGVAVEQAEAASVIVLAANATKTATATATGEKARADKAANDLTAANEKAANDLKAATDKAATELTAANEKFAGERKARVKLLLDAKVSAGHVTGAERTAFEGEFANEATFDATLAKLEAKQGTKLPGQRQAGIANIGSRQVQPEAQKRREKVAQMVNEEMKKAVYANLDQQVRYSRAFAAVKEANPALWEASGN